TGGGAAGGLAEAQAELHHAPVLQAEYIEPDGGGVVAAPQQVLVAEGAGGRADRIRADPPDRAVINGVCDIRVEHVRPRAGVATGGERQRGASSNNRRGGSNPLSHDRLLRQNHSPRRRGGHARAIMTRGAYPASIFDLRRPS